MKLSRQIQQTVHLNSFQIRSNGPYRNERSHFEDQKEVQIWAIEVVSDVSGLSGDQTFAFVIQSTCDNALGSIGSIFKGRAHEPASMIHTSVQWLLMVPLPKQGSLLAPFCHSAPSSVPCLWAQEEHIQTQVWGLKVDFLQLVTWRLPEGSCPPPPLPPQHTHTHTNTQRDRKR